ncbi:phosphotyrosine protein phosphatase [Nostoc linckia FACHB-104]|nr:phosphotyrosine protein phosphatase [Nostoc linckia FACHB-104]
MQKLLFLCSQNRLRSPTAEVIFAEYEGLETDSAGLDRYAEVPVSTEAIAWADIIFVMEKSHKQKLAKNFQPFLKDKRVICLDIPDEYEYMEPSLIELLKKKVLPLLGKKENKGDEKQRGRG